MKNFFLKAILPVIALSANLWATPEDEAPAVSVQYNHRMVVFHPGFQGYEYMPNDDVYVGANLHVGEAYNVVDRDIVLIASAELRLGRSFFYNGQDHVRPIVGGGIYRDMSTVCHYVWDQNGWHQIGETKNPMIAYGLVGCMFEREFNDRLALGLNAKVLFGSIAGNRYEVTRNFYYGADVSLPFTIRLGSARRWDLRLEPYALVMNDGTRYIGNRSSIAYRF